MYLAVFISSCLSGAVVFAEIESVGPKLVGSRWGFETKVGLKEMRYINVVSPLDARS
jgi:hypothetical protein